MKLKDKDIQKSLSLGEKIAVRVPNSKCALSLLKECKLLVGTSANISGTEPFNDPKECDENLTGYDLFMDGVIISSEGASTIVEIENNNVNILDYGKGTGCGGDIFKNDGKIFRTYNGGVAMLNNDLSIQPLGKIGSYNANNLYSASGSMDKVFLGLTSDYIGPDTVYVHNYFGELTSEYIVGALPGDYEVYQIK